MMHWQPLLRGFSLLASALFALPGSADQSIWIGRFDPEKTRGVYFVTTEIARHSAHFTTGNKLALGSTIDQQGFRSLVMTGIAIGDRTLMQDGSRARITQSRILFGYEAHWGDMVPAVYIGLSRHAYGEDEAMARNRSHRLGVVGMIDLWKNWADADGISPRFTAFTLLVDGAEESLYFGAKQGFSVPGISGALGGEASLSLGTERKSGGVVVRSAWQKARAGLGWYEIPAGRLTLSISAGGEIHRGARASPYAQMSARMRY